MLCKNCGCELQPGIKFCPVCGTKAVRICSECGAQVDEGIKFCPNCGKEIEKASVEENEGSSTDNIDGRPNTSQESLNSDHLGTGSINLKRGIVDKNIEYYETQFESLQASSKCKFNWASFFLGLFHAAYRNVWKEWLKGPGLPQIISALAMLSSGAIMFISGSSVVTILVTVVLGIAQIVGIVMHIRFAYRFNRIYMQHVSEKVEKNDYGRDPSVPRAILVATVFGIALSTCQGIYAAGSISSLVTTTNTENKVEISEILPASKKQIAKFAKKNKLLDDDDIGIYSNTGIMIIPNEDGTILTLSIMEPGYLLYGLEVGSRFLVPEDNGKLTMQGYTYLMTEGEEIIFGIPEKTGIQGGDNQIRIRKNKDSIIEGIIYSVEGAEEIAALKEEYFLVDSASRYLTKEEIADLSVEEIIGACIEIFARHGATFDKLDNGDTAQKYFNEKSWYYPIKDFDDIEDSELNEYEVANLEMLMSLAEAKDPTQKEILQQMESEAVQAVPDSTTTTPAEKREIIAGYYIEPNNEIRLSISIYSDPEDLFIGAIEYDYGFGYDHYMILDSESSIYPLIDSMGNPCGSLEVLEDKYIILEIFGDETTYHCEEEYVS